MKKNLLITATSVLLLSTSCGHRVNDAITIIVYTDSIVSDMLKHSVGISLNFIMDGGCSPEAKKNVTEVVKELGTKYLRYPGGEKSDLYLFSIPPYEESHTSLVRTIGLDDCPRVFKGGEFVYDPLDFDEFIKAHRDVGAEPVLVIAVDNYLRKLGKEERVPSREALTKHAAEWVKYTNIKKEYNVRYRMIGNESWNKNNENSTVEIYAQDIIGFSKVMKAMDPSILVIPNGDSDKFFKTIINKAGNYIDRLCVSNYDVFDFNAGYESYRDTTHCLIWPVQTALNAMNKYATQEQLDKWELITVECGTIDQAGSRHGTNNMGHATVNFDMTGQLLLEPQIGFLCF